MGFRHVTLRQRLFHGVFHAATDPTHGHWQEYVTDFAYILANAMFVVGSVCFFEVWVNGWVYKLGDWLFIIGSLINFLLTTYSFWEQILAKKHMTARFIDEDRNEVRETLMFVIASFIFAVGAIFYMPDIYPSSKAERWGHEFGAWSFVVGSIGLCLASYYNALGLAMAKAKCDKNDDVAEVVYSINCWALALTQLGSVLFVSGSFLYRPAFANHCSNEIQTIDTAANNGTMLYLIGSVVYLAQSLLSLASGIIKHDRACDLDESAPILQSRNRRATSIK